MIIIVMLILQRACYSYLMHIWHPFIGNFVTHHRDLHDPKLIETKTDVKPSSRLCNRKTWNQHDKWSNFRNVLFLGSVFMEGDISALYGEPD